MCIIDKLDIENLRDSLNEHGKSIVIFLIILLIIVIFLVVNQSRNNLAILNISSYL
ncbi:MAG: hypothetical protein ACTHWZ_03830 [Peptoniphilaceae bacterium]